MKLLEALRAGTLATGSFIAAIFRHEDAVASVTAEGYPVLARWPHSPEQAVAQSARRRPALRAGRYALYCYDGTHRGETVTLKREVETVGTEARNTVVLTPAPGNTASALQFLLQDGLRCAASASESFRVNGREVREAALYDFDRLDFGGNRFVVFDLTGGWR